MANTDSKTDLLLNDKNIFNGYTIICHTVFYKPLQKLL